MSIGMEIYKADISSAFDGNICE